MSRPDSIQRRMHRLVVIFCGFMAAILAIMLALVFLYNSQHTGFLYNVTTASEFNQDFKENIDLKMSLRAGTPRVCPSRRWRTPRRWLRTC